jgi:MFS family permease
VRSAAATVALGAVAKFASGPGQSFFIAVFVDHLIRDAGVSRTGFASLYALATTVSAAMVLAIGRLVDRRGVRVVWLGVAAGLASACVGLSLATGPLMVLLALSLMRGFGQGSFPLLGTVLIATRFEARRGRAFSAAAQGVTLAGIVLPGVAAALIALFGWRHALQLVALGIVVAIVPLGLLTSAKRGSVEGPVPDAHRLGATLRRPGVLPLLLILAAPPLITTAVVINAVSLLGAAGISPGAAAASLGLTSLAGAAGAIAGGQLADRRPPHVILGTLGGILAAGIGLLLLGAAGPSFAGLVLLGLATGMSATANGTVWASVYGLEGIGALQGVASAGQVAGAAAGPLPIAALLALTGGYSAGLGLLLAIAVAAAVAGARWRPARDQPARGRPRVHPRLQEELA